MDKRIAPNRPLKTICVFCGSSPGIDPDFAVEARRLGTLIAQKSYRLVFGAGNVGLMGEVARAAEAQDGNVIGILPQYLRHLEPPLKGTDELIVTPTMQQRKQRMIALSDAFIHLPGGIGTMDEFFEVLTEAQLGAHAKPIILVNLKKFYEPLRVMMQHIVDQGFARTDISAHYRYVDTVDEALEAVDQALQVGRI